MQVQRLFFEDDQPLQAWQAGENRRGGGAAGNRDGGGGMLLAQLFQDSGRDYGIANSRRGNEQDAHAPPL
jgi:hypothetical protein